MSQYTDNDEEELQEQEELHGQMSFLDHLEELRNRLIRMLIAVGVAFGVCWWQAGRISRIIQIPIAEAITGEKIKVMDELHQVWAVIRYNASPLANSAIQLNMLKATDGFNLAMKVAFLGGIFLASPFIMWQIWGFISPGLYKRERRYALPFVISSTVLFFIGGLFGYFVAFPYAMKFLIEFGLQDMGMKPMISGLEYFDQFIAIELCLGIVFLLPALIFLLSRFGLVSGSFLLRNTKYAVLIIFIIAAVITPTPDIPDMMVVAVPMLGLYLLGVIVAYLFGKKRKTEEADA
jgi:sec-independent protein translocase protein TatC